MGDRAVHVHEADGAVAEHRREQRIARLGPRGIVSDETGPRAPDFLLIHGRHVALTVTTTGSRRVGSSGGCAAAGETARRLRSSAEKHTVIWRRAGGIVGRACYTRGPALTSPRPRRIVRAAK